MKWITFYVVNFMDALQYNTLTNTPGTVAVITSDGRMIVVRCYIYIKYNTMILTLPVIGIDDRDTFPLHISLGDTKRI